MSGSPTAEDSGRLAPVALFAHARPEHLARTVSSLTRNAEARFTDLFVFCDGARNESEMPRVEKVRHVVDAIEGFASITVVRQHDNLGLSRSIIQGVSDVLRQRGRAIVLEDDLVLSPHFLSFMNSGLDRYRGDDRVASVHGYCYPTPTPLPPTFFLKGADCWGWATWSRAWQHFEPDGSKLLHQLQDEGRLDAFDLDGAFPFSRMLIDQIEGRNDSWAVRWHAACYLKGLLTLYPGRSLVDNIGNDGSGTHSETSSAFSHRLEDALVEVLSIPVEESAIARQAFVDFGRSRQSLTERVKHGIRRWAYARR